MNILDIIWFDAQGHMRIDVRCSFTKKAFIVEAWVKVGREGRPNSWAGVGTPIVIPKPTGLNRSERARIKRACADMAANELGHPYTLRSKL